MKNYPSIALIECSSVAAGILTADSMVKKAPITVLKSGTVHDGKFLILIGGSVASVEEAYNLGISIASDKIIDHVLLPDVHNQVHNAILGARNSCSYEALGVIESTTVAATIKSADAAIKGSNIDIVEIRIADDLGGKAFAIYSGEIEDIEAALMISKNSVTKKEYWIRDTIIPRLSEEIADQINLSTTFSKVDIQKLAESEI